MTTAATLLDGRYWLGEQIGAGGFCEVWRAVDTVLMRPVAVKLLHAGYAHQSDAQARFKAEARHAGALSHKNIACIYDYGEPSRGQAYLVMELIEGPSLAAVLAGGPLGVARTMDIVAEVAAGLQAAHSAGLVHRDIKPANVLFTSEGTARITDFGIAHAVGSAPLTITGMVMGTPGYLAPERVAGARAGPASDLYALGIVAYECLAGHRPFSGPALEVAISHRDRPLPPLPGRLPAEVTAFVMILTAKDPAWRPATAGEVADQAHRLRDNLVCGAIGRRPVRAAAPLTITDGLGSQARNPVRPQTHRRRALGAAVLAALTCLLLLTVTVLASASHPAAPPSSGPHRALPSLAKPPSTAFPVAAQRAGQQPSVAPNTGPGAVAAVRHTPARHPTAKPGPPRHKKHPRHPNAPAPRSSPGPGPGISQAPAVAAAGNVSGLK